MAVEVFEFSTRVPDVAQSVLSRAYETEGPIRFAGVAEDFACDLRSATTGELGADRLLFSTGMRTAMAPVDYFMAAVGVQGSCDYRVGREEVVLRPGGAFRYPTTAALTAAYAGIEIRSLRLPLVVLERVAAERFDLDAGDLRFDGSLPVSDAACRGWLRLARYVDAQLVDPDAVHTSPLVVAALTELVAATALTTFANTTMTSEHLAGAGWVAPAVVRRALAFIDANASLAISVSDVARAAGVGPRALQAAFARHVGRSPREQLHRVRLEAAHRELQAGDATAGDTVAATARRWGFAKPDRFATAYRAVYGVAPSHTLRT